jgi:hypothetical protein
MTTISDDAVAHFSRYAKQFDAYYRERDEFAERLEIWCGLLDRYAISGGFSIDIGCGTATATVGFARSAIGG